MTYFFTKLIYITMYGAALLIVFVLFIIYSFGCAYEDSESKSPLIIMSNVIGNGVKNITHAIKVITGSIVKGVKLGVKNSSNTFDDGYSQVRNKNESNIDDLRIMEGMDGEHTSTGSVSMYDPIQMGAISESELNAHNKNLRERSPYSTTGVAGPQQAQRDDDPFTRDTKVPWVVFPPTRSFNRKIGGPQEGARATISTTSESIADLYKSSRKAPVWIS